MPGGLVPVAEAHTIPARVAAERFRWNIVSVSNTGPNQAPVVVFSVTDPTNGNAAWDLTDPAFTTGSGVSRLAILVGWDSRDHTGNPSMQVEFDNQGSGSSRPGSRLEARSR